MPSADIARYAARQDPQRAAICGKLQASIDAGLPNATSKLWHAIPVWFIGENAVVGFQARKTGVMLMFWNGQHFGEPELEASGSFHMAQKVINDASEIDEAQLSRWLEKAGTSIWDMVGERHAFVAQRRASKAKAKPAKKAAKVKPVKGKAAKPKVAKPKARTKAKARASTRPVKKARSKK
jgi:hypothetical protein